jgi:hypothetical protein
MEFAQWVLNWFIPPLSHDENVQYWWRVRIAFFGCLSFSGVCIISLFLLGLIPRVQAPVMADDLTPLRTQITNVQKQAMADTGALRQDIATDRSERIEGEVLQLRILHCAAKKGAAKDLYWNRISALLIRYQQLTGRVYPLANCTDL